MKKVLLVVAIVVVIAVAAFAFVKLNEKKNESSEEPNGTSASEEKNGTSASEEPNGTSGTNEDEVVIELGEETEINTLKEIKISGTDDTFIVTDDVKWEVPYHGEGVTVSFAIQIPYKFTIEGKEYEGIYELGDGSGISKEDGNPKYDIKVTNLDAKGIVTVLIEEK